MPQNVAIRTSGAQFDFLEPAMVPDYARTDHVTVPNAGAGLFVTYLKGQILRQKDDGTNVFAKDGTAGYTGPVRVVKYTFTINDAGQRQRIRVHFRRIGRRILPRFFQMSGPCWYSRRNRGPFGSRDLCNGYLGTRSRDTCIITR
jgi:hypothetical protein